MGFYPGVFTKSSWSFPYRGRKRRFVKFSRYGLNKPRGSYSTCVDSIVSRVSLRLDMDVSRPKLSISWANPFIICVCVCVCVCLCVCDHTLGETEGRKDSVAVNILHHRMHLIQFPEKKRISIKHCSSILPAHLTPH